MKRPTAAMATKANSNGHRVVRISALLPLTVTLVAADVVVPTTVKVPPFVAVVNSLSELTAKL